MNVLRSEFFRSEYCGLPAPEAIDAGVVFLEYHNVKKKPGVSHVVAVVPEHQSHHYSKVRDWLERRFKASNSMKGIARKYLLYDVWNTDMYSECKDTTSVFALRFPYVRSKIKKLFIPTYQIRHMDALKIEDTHRQCSERHKVMLNEICLREEGNEEAEEQYRLARTNFRESEKELKQLLSPYLGSLGST
jgi:hypothetical protein